MIQKKALTTGLNTAKSWPFMHKLRYSKALWAPLTLVLVVLTPIPNNRVAIASVGEELVLGTSADFPPYEYYTTVDGVDQIVGFDIDIANEIAAQLGFTFTIRDQSFETLIPSLQADQLDFVIAGLNATPERRDLVDFSNPYYQEFFALISREEKPVNGLEDLINTNLGVQSGSTAETEVINFRNTIGGLEVVSFARLEDLINSLESGDISAGLVADQVAQRYVDLNPSLQFVALPSLGELKTFIAFPKGSSRVDDFNYVIAQLQQNNELDRLVDKWFFTDIPDVSSNISVNPPVKTVSEPSLTLALLSLLIIGTRLKRKQKKQAANQNTSVI